MATLNLREAKAYLESARLVHRGALNFSSDISKWINRNPMFFLVLHATELAAKACLMARRQQPPRTHDVVFLFSEIARAGPLSCFRETYRSVRALQVRRIEGKRSGDRSKFAKTLMQIEIGEVGAKPVFLNQTLRVFGAPEQPEMTRLEFGKEVTNYFHVAKYPRLRGVTSYPDFEVCTLICAPFIKLASKEAACT